MATIRQVIKARDIQNFFGKKERQSFKMMAGIRKALSKKPFQPITIDDFCQYYDVKPEGLIMAMQATDEWENQNADKRRTKNDAAQEIGLNSLETNTYSFQNQHSKPAAPYVFSNNKY